MKTLRIAQIAVLAAAVLTGTGVLAEEGASPNVKVVEAFFAAGDSLEKAGAVLSDKVSVRLEEGKPAIRGRLAYIAAMKKQTAHGEKLTAKIQSSYAAGPVVVARRIDTLTVPGEKPQIYKLVGVFIVEGGKITEWSDYADE